jgi:type I restriction enzyme, S subunit
MSFEDWKVEKLKNLTLKIGSGATPKGGKESYKESGISFIRSQNVLNHTFTKEGLVYIDEDQANKLNNVIVEEEDVLLNITGDSVCRCCIVPSEILPARVNQHVCIIRCDPQKILPHYLKSYLNSPYMQSYMLSLAYSGGTRAALTKGMIENFDIPVPSIGEQSKIVSLLSSIEKKIELNNQINKNLEEMAQAIFKSWFVDFEPFQDGEFVESELGLIPKGWEVGNFNKLVSELIGGDWGKEEPQKNHQQKVYCIRGADIPEVARGNKGKIPVRYILEKNALKKSLKSGDIVIEISGGSPTQSTGRAVLINDELLERFDSSLICTNFCRVIKLKEDYYSTFVYLYLKYLYEKEVFFQFENGTTGIKNLDITSFLEVYQIVIPSKEILNTFNNLVDKCFSSIQQLGKENEILSNLRDTLLPKLMSGEIRVPL